MVEFCMPTLGADMTEGTVTKWLVRPGDRIERGDIVVEIETDKANMEVESFQAGVLERIVVPEGEKVPVGTVLAIFCAAEGAKEAVEVVAPAPLAKAPAPAPVVAATAPPVAPPVHEHALRITPAARKLAEERGVAVATLRGTGIDGAITRADVERAARGSKPEAGAARQRVSPFARRLAAEMAVDLATVEGGGPGGAVTADDIRRAAERKGAPAAPAAVAEVLTEALAPAARTRAPIAALMERSNREIPHYFLELDIDMSRALAWLAEENARRPVTERLIYSALLVKAIGLACRDVPEVNGYWTDGVFQPSPVANVGVAVSLRGGGLVAPAIADAASKPITQVMAELRDLVGRARGGRLRASEMTSGTITITNLGEMGVDGVFGVIYPPQVALVGFGRIREQPWAEHGMVGVRPVMRASLAADHRASDGHRGGLFLSAINRLLQEPEKL